MKLARAARASGFTLTELVVVITVVVILLAMAIPAFRETIRTSEESLAETKLRLAIQAGRDAAMRSDRGADTAAVFFYEPGGRVSVVVCEHAGSFTDFSPPYAATGVERDVFIPVASSEPLQLPKGWMVRAFVPAGGLKVLNDSGGQRAWYEGGRYDEDARSWIFPETGWFDQLGSATDGRDRQTFLVRFRGGTGEVAVGDSRDVLVLSTRATSLGRNTPPFSDYRIDQAKDTGEFVRRLLARADLDPKTELSVLVGDQSGDTVLARSVEHLALYREVELATAVGLQVDRVTGCLYREGNDPRWVAKFGPTQLKQSTQWFEGDTDYDGKWLDPDGNDRPTARLYAVQRYTGAVEPIPLTNFDALGSGGSSP